MNLVTTTAEIANGHPAQPASRRPTAYLLGIAGAGMRSLALVLEQFGWRIMGSDTGDATSLPPRWRLLPTDDLPLLAADDVIVHTPAVDEQHPLLAMARRLDYPVVSYPAMLGRLMQSRQGIAIAGTHGKSTTTAMVATILRHAGFDPTVVVGAEPVAPHAASGAGRGPHIVVEACEYRDSFLHLRPTIAAILNIDWDHCDWFAAPVDVGQAFVHFARQLAAGGTLVLPWESRLLDLLDSEPAFPARQIITFDCNPSASVHCGQICTDNGQSTFDLVLHGQPAGQVALQVPGRHNVQNALAAAAVAHAAGVHGSAICAGLSSFTGLRRRLEYLGMAAGVHFIDDYAHHPTEIAATLATVRQNFANSQVWCVFEPHQAGRTKSLLNDLALSLQNADTLAIGDIFRARENPTQPPQATEADLARTCRTLGASVLDEHDLAALEQALVAARRHGTLLPGDVLVTLGAGRIGSFAHGVFQRFREDFTHG